MSTLKEIAVKRLEELNLGPVEAAVAAGLERTFIRDIVEDKKKSVRADKLAGLATALSLDAEGLARGVAIPLDQVENRQPMLKIVGKAGAGPDGTVSFATGDGNLGEIPVPEGVSPHASVLEIQGTSMRGIAEDGWLIIYEEKEFPNEDHMGEPCVCFLNDDRVLVKVPHPGSSRGLFHLESMNAPTMYDVPVLHFALIVDIKPRRAAQKYMKRNPSKEIQDVTLDGRRLASGNS